MEKKSTKKTTQTVSSEICRWIENQGIRHVFLVPGVQIEPLCCEMELHENLTVIVACHELGAGFMADGYARVTEKPGICAGIGGPGASYLLASAMIARVDDSNVVYITGDVPTQLKEIFCFQDTGYSGSRDREVFKALIDYSVTISEPDDTYNILDGITKHLNLKLPAHLVIPFNIQSESINKLKNENCDSEDSSKTIYNNQKDIALTIYEKIQKAKHPIFLTGHRLYGKSGIENLKSLAELTGSKVATTYRAKGIFPEDHPLSLGNFGYAGTKAAYNAILGNECDLLIMLGFNISQRDTYSFHEQFMPDGRNTIFIDTKDVLSDLNWKNYQKFIVQDISLVLAAVLSLFNDLKKGNQSRKLYTQIINSNQANTNTANNKSLRLDTALFRLRALTPSSTMLFVDSGSHRTVAGTAWKVSEAFTFFTSDLEAPMGWAICAAIGAKLARPQSPTIVLTGDGCMRMHAMEIATAVRYSLAVIFLVSNNTSYYTIYNRVQTKSAIDSIGKLPLIDWSQFAKSIGADGCVVTEAIEFEQAIERALASDKPFIIDLRTSPDEKYSDEITIPENVWPQLNIKNIK